MSDQRAVALAHRQLGLITRQQAHAVGVTERAIRERVQRGAWTVARRGVYVVGAAAPSWEQRVMAAALAGGDDVVASHRTALRVWGLVKACGRLELLVQGDRRVRVAGVTVHQSILLPAIDRTYVGVVPVTSMARTLIDASPRQDPRTVGRWIDDAMRAGTLDLRELRSCLARLLGPGRRSIRTIQEALALRLEGYDPGDSDLEARVLDALVGFGLPMPVQQHPVRRSDGKDAAIDLAYPEVMIAIEADGWDSHGARSAFDPDRIRANELTLLGWRVFRFTSTMDLRSFVATIATAYNDAMRLHA